ncbi:serine/threonine-protein phosphatase 4 regulatory subunit 2 isoform X2 [Populus trichocarpa]|uniref:serine/threonine-protein phosphatase 4 regulatory subunit 2 isoform X2 n=1 Tax=Populus trichocarpa TaxID=3694 RepID=UPI0022794799|nr:serine/threonine-protein phosphatase 4 regulatory subunit 2 isoform X2 [Populus trichocarpa]
METAGVPPLICFLFSLLLSISKQNTQLHFSPYNFIIVAKPSFLTLFLVFHFIIITIFVGRPKSSVEDLEDSFSSIPPPSVYEMDETIQEVEVCGSTGSTDDEDDDQSYSTFDGYDDNYHVSDGYVEDMNDDVNDAEGDQDSEDDAVSDAEGDQDSEDHEEYDNELEKKIEGFIEKVYQERWEEFLRDRFLCISAG